MVQSRWFAAVGLALLAAPLPGGCGPAPPPATPPAWAAARPPIPAPPVGADSIPVQGDYVFVPGMKGPVALLHEGYVIPGNLDAAGTFLPDPKCLPYKWGEGRSAGRAYRVINCLPGTAYEYRSGRLILGFIDQEGTFIPDLGSKVISIKDYKPGGNAAPIYNLPGKFVKKGEEEGKDEP